MEMEISSCSSWVTRKTVLVHRRRQISVASADVQGVAYFYSSGSYLIHSFDALAGFQLPLHCPQQIVVGPKRKTASTRNLVVQIVQPLNMILISWIHEMVLSESSFKLVLCSDAFAINVEI